MWAFTLSVAIEITCEALDSIFHFHILVLRLLIIRHRPSCPSYLLGSNLGLLICFEHHSLWLCPSILCFSTLPSSAGSATSSAFWELASDRARRRISTVFTLRWTLLSFSCWDVTTPAMSKSNRSHAVEQSILISCQVVANPIELHNDGGRHIIYCRLVSGAAKATFDDAAWTCSVDNGTNFVRPAIPKHGSDILWVFFVHGCWNATAVFCLECGRNILVLSMCRRPFWEWRGF